MDKGMLVILSAPAGCGKDTVIRRLIQKDDSIVFSVSSTTRNKRENEIDGVDYNFVTRDEFETLIENNEMLEYAQYNGNYYGTPIKPLKGLLERGKTVILKIEIQGAQEVMKKLGSNVTSIFLIPPSFAELRRRLTERGTESPQDIENRLQIAQSELEFAKHYNYTVVNGDLSEAVCDILSIFRAEKKKTDKNLKLISEVIKNA